MIINNAGIGDNAPGMDKISLNHKFFDIPTEAVKAIVETNFIGFFMVVSNFIQFMLENGGSIVYLKMQEYHDSFKVVDDLHCWVYNYFKIIF